MDVIYSDEADKYLKKLDAHARSRIIKKMDEFATRDNPLAEATRLTGSVAYRFRIGDSRVIFYIEQELIYVALIDRRDKVYKKI